MIRFKSFIKEGFTHSAHLEDLILNLGSEGTLIAIKALKDFKDTFAGKSNAKNINLSIKWDGAPAVVFGTDPVTGKFFVGSKNAFSKTNPKVAFTHKDIDKQYNAGPASKLHDALDYLKGITPKGKVYQGDFLYSQSELKYADINGEKNVIMHPNTIVYSAPVDSDIGKKIINSKIGIVVHTEYTGGPTIQDMKPVFGASTKSFKDSKDVWVNDAVFDDNAGVGNLTAEETKIFDDIIKQAGSLYKATSSKTFDILSTDKTMNSLVNEFNNSIIKAGEDISPSKQAKMFKDWLTNRFDLEKSQLKTQSGVAKKEERKQELLNLISTSELEKIFSLQKIIATGKKIVIDKLNEINKVGTFVKTKDGYKVTNHEGFVGISGDISGVKLVDRLEFSHNNFSNEIIKGWDRNGN